VFNSHSLIRCWLAGALVCAALPVISGNAQRAVPRAAATTTEADELFDAGELHDIWIHINARDWEQLRTAYRENTYYPADIEWRGVKVRNAGIRVRGRTSRTPHKPALRIDFNRYVAGQEFLGLKSLALDNLWQDPSMIRERLAMQIFRRMGLQAPRESHARVYVGGTREFAGVYGVVEAIDKDFLQRSFGENDGFLYEYEWQEPYGFEPLREDLEWYAARFSPKTHETAATSTLFAPIRELVDAINNAPETRLEEELQPYLNLRRYITHIAVENFLSEPDGLLGGLGMNNFYLYRFEGTNHSAMIPWDQDLAFELLESPPPWHNFEANVLARKIWSMPELRNVYLQTLVDVAASVGPPVGSRPVTDSSTRQCPAPPGAPRCGWLETEIVREYEQIREAALADPRSPHPDEAFEEAIEFLKRFARERGDVVRSYVAALTPELVEPPDLPSSDSLRFRSLPVRRPR
jgi:CotH kinase protein